MFKSVKSSSVESIKSQSTKQPKGEKIKASINRMAYRAKHLFAAKASTASTMQTDAFVKSCKLSHLAPNAQEMMRRFHDSHCSRNPNQAVDFKSYLAFALRPSNK